VSGTALDVALAYYEAWTNKDFERAMTYVADDIVCEAPPGRIEGAPAYRDFMGPFVQILASAPAAECLTVENGKIVRSRFIFDRAPFQAARENATSSSRAASPPNSKLVTAR
jgi:ketosteroid isomerase-like protein